MCVSVCLCVIYAQSDDSIASAGVDRKTEGIQPTKIEQGQHVPKGCCMYHASADKNLSFPTSPSTD